MKVALHLISPGSLRRVKFGAFFDHLQSKHEGEFDRVASGHYARLVRGNEDEPVRLTLTPDAVKDQTYFLANLSQEQLSGAMFPLGSLTKVLYPLFSSMICLCTPSC